MNKERAGIGLLCVSAAGKIGIEMAASLEKGMAHPMATIITRVQSAQYGGGIEKGYSGD